MQAQISVAIICHILTNLQLPEAIKAAPASSGERVHIRLHMPEIVRQHTHIHQVYHPSPPHGKKVLSSPPIGKPHVSLLGYTTLANGASGLAPSLMQLLATSNTPMTAPSSTLAPNYGPALFNSYNKEITGTEAGTKETTIATMPPTMPSVNSYMAATAPSAPPSTSGLKMKLKQQKQEKLLQQLFKPNIIAAMMAAKQQQQQQQQKQQHQMQVMEPDAEVELETEPEPEPELQQNDLLNVNFLAALQRELINKFGKRKKLNYRQKSNYKKPKYSNYMQNEYEDNDDYIEDIPLRTATDDNSDEHYESVHGDDNDDATIGYDNAVAFSGQDNAMSSVANIDEFWNDVQNNNANDYDPYGSTYNQINNFNNNLYDNENFDNSEFTGNSWQTAPAAASKYATAATRPATTPTKLRPRQRRPAPTKVRYVKLLTRKKRKNRIKSKKYRL